MKRINALTIAGTDPSGGAGIQADLKTFSALGAYGCSVITALVAQNTCGVQSVYRIEPDFVAAQLDSVFSDVRIDTTKIGMLAETDIVEAVAERLQRHHVRNVVLDTVMLAKSGDPLLSPSAIETLRVRLLPQVSLITPNLPEAAALLDAPHARTEQEMLAQGRALVEPDGERTFMSFSGVENQWNADWLSQLRTPRGSLVYLSGYQLASSCGEPLIQWLETVDDVTPFIDFGPRIGDITDDVMARIMACRPIVSLNRQEAIIAAERAGLATDTRTFGEAWVNRFSAPLVVRHDKDGAWYFSAQSSGVVPAFPATVVDTIGAGDSHAGGVLAGLASGWPLADAVLLGNAVASWVVGHRGGDCAPTREALLLAHKNV